MNAFLELILAAHRAVWLPVYLALGLEAEPITLPVQFAPALAATAGPVSIETRHRQPTRRKRRQTEQ
ncbi:MAG: hypothetical protein WD904_08800 [Dehalococcoidia bacterium]